MRVIAHIDMDAFFASAEEVRNPSLKGKPVIIGSDPKEGKGRGVVSAANYEARKYNVHSALPISIAWQRCPNGIYLRPDIKYYSELSKTIMKILNEFSSAVEQVSVDEAFLDLSGTEKLFGTKEQIALTIKKAIFDRTKLRSSIGIASSKSLAKIASDLNKPDGICIIPNGKEEETIAPLPVSALWGVGKVFEKVLAKENIFTIRELQNISKDSLIERWGKTGEHLWKMVHAIDDRPVLPAHLQERVKSISRENTFGEDTTDKEKVESTLFLALEESLAELRALNLSAKTITFKIRFSNFKTYQRRKTISYGSDDFVFIKSELKEMLSEFIPFSLPVRLIGAGLSGLTENINGSNNTSEQLLFDAVLSEGVTQKNRQDENGSQSEHRKKIDHIMDRLEKKMGKGTLIRATHLKK